MTDSDIELQHIWLEVQAQRWQNVARFLFSYYCYQHNLVSKSNKPCWETARNKLPASNAIQTRNNTVIEPLVPEETVVGLLKALSKSGKISFDEMQSTLKQHLHYVVISKQEKAKLKPSMPTDWYQQAHKSVMARFEISDIFIREK